MLMLSMFRRALSSSKEIIVDLPVTFKVTMSHVHSSLTKSSSNPWNRDRDSCDRGCGCNPFVEHTRFWLATASPRSNLDNFERMMSKGVTNWMRLSGIVAPDGRLFRHHGSVAHGGGPRNLFAADEEGRALAGIPPVPNPEPAEAVQA